MDHAAERRLNSGVASPFNVAVHHCCPAGVSGSSRPGLVDAQFPDQAIGAVQLLQTLQDSRLNHSHSYAVRLDAMAMAQDDGEDLIDQLLGQSQ